MIRSNDRTLWLFLLVLPPLFWSGNALVGRWAVGEIPPLALSFWRWVLAFALLAPFTWRDVLANRARFRERWVAVLFMGLFSVGAYNTLLYLAVQTTTAINATLMGTAMPLMMIIIARFWLGEAVHGRQMLGLAVSALGLLAVIAKGEPARLLGLALTPGDLLMLLATLSWALYSVMLRRYPVAVKGTTLLTVLIAVGAISIFPFYVWETAQGGHWRPNSGNLAAIAYTSLFASILAYYFWNRGVAAVGAGTAGLYSYLIPLFAAVLAVLLLGEQFRWFHALGGVLIFAGIALATMVRKGP